MPWCHGTHLTWTTTTTTTAAFATTTATVTSTPSTTNNNNNNHPIFYFNAANLALQKPITGLARDKINAKNGKQ
jgi:hypothetical protein